MNAKARGKAVRRLTLEIVMTGTACIAAWALLRKVAETLL